MPPMCRKVIFSDWAEFVGNYTQRSMSFANDKLVALSALAGEIGQPLSLSYFAGLWRRDCFLDADAKTLTIH